MRALFSIAISACLLLAASACSSELAPEQEDFDLKGEIVQIADYGEKDLRILLQYADKSLTGGTGKVRLIVSDETELLKQADRSLQRVGSDDLKIGQEVRAWSSDVWLYSKPPQAGARRVIIEE